MKRTPLSIPFLSVLALLLWLYCGTSSTVTSRSSAGIDRSTLERNIAEALQKISHMPLEERPHSGTKDSMYRRAERPGESPLITRLSLFAHWLENQEHVESVQLPFHSAGGVHSTRMLLSYPAQIPIGVRVRLRGEGFQDCQLFVRVEKHQALTFAGLERIPAE